MIYAVAQRVAKFEARLEADFITVETLLSNQIFISIIYSSQIEENEKKNLPIGCLTNPQPHVMIVVGATAIKTSQ